jgi:hypothetical protein
LVTMTGQRRKAAFRARAALGWGLALFALGQLCVGLWLRAEPEIGEREFGRKLTDLRVMLAAHPGRPLVLMLGSSRVATGFRPEALPQFQPGANGPPIAFNFALVGTGPEMSHLVLHRLLAAGIRPAWVLVEYWPPFWSTRRTDKNFFDQVNVGHLDLGGVRLLAGYLAHPRRLFSAWLTTQMAPAYADRSALLSRLAPSWFPRPPASDHHLRHLDQSGWWSPATPGDPEYGPELLARMRRHYAPILAKFHTAEIPDRALRQLLDRCRNERIGAAVVVLPEGDAFRSWYPSGALAEVDAYLDRLASDCRVPVIDARMWVPEPLFMDSHHLFPEGATRFTSQLGRVALPPLLAGREGPVRSVSSQPARESKTIR